MYGIFIIKSNCFLRFAYFTVTILANICLSEHTSQKNENVLKLTVFFHVQKLQVEKRLFYADPEKVEQN